MLRYFAHHNQVHTLSQEAFAIIFGLILLGLIITIIIQKRRSDS